MCCARLSPRLKCSSGPGFSLLEFVVVIALIGMLIAVAATRLLPYIDEAERVAVLRLEGQLRSSLTMEAAQRVVRGESASLSELNGSNPIKFLLEPPKNYVGERRIEETEHIPPRRWYFEQDRQRLVYRLGSPFSGPDTDQAAQNPAFEVRVAFADTDRNGVFDAQRDELYGVRLRRIAGEQWLSGLEQGVH